MLVEGIPSADFHITQMSLTIENLLSDLKTEQSKAKHHEDDDFVLVQQLNDQWSKIFDTYFLSTTTRLPSTSTSTTGDDDLIFYVTRKTANDIQYSATNKAIEVYRHHDIKRRPKLGAAEYDWEETINLNLVLHQFEYIVTTAVCLKIHEAKLDVLKRFSTTVYASPSRRSMEDKGTEERITHPNMYFTVDSFQDTFGEMVVNEGQLVCVELIAKNPFLHQTRVLFLGSIKYEALKRVYDSRATTSTRIAQRMSLGMYRKQRVEFVRMRGPGHSQLLSISPPHLNLLENRTTASKGHAEVAVSGYRPAESNTSTPPESPASTPTNDDFDDDSWNRRDAIESNSDNSLISSSLKQRRSDSNVTTSDVESIDARSEALNNKGGLFGRTLNQAMSWVRSPTLTLSRSINDAPLQICLTYLTLPCSSIVQDILESNTKPILTA